MENLWLLLAGLLSIAAAAMHVAIIFGGADWYRFFGAGEKMAAMAERGSPVPAVITTGIAVTLFAWGLYALSGSGLIHSLPWRHEILLAITTVYLARGLLGLMLPPFIQHPIVTQQGPAFWIWSSVICTGLGLVHLVGISSAGLI